VSEENTPQRSSVGPVQYDKSHPVHKQIVDMALGIVISSVVNVSPFLSEDEWKQEVHSALTTATRCFTDVGEVVVPFKTTDISMHINRCCGPLDL